MISPAVQFRSRMLRIAEAARGFSEISSVLAFSLPLVTRRSAGS